MKIYIASVKMPKKLIQTTQKTLRLIDGARQEDTDWKPRKTYLEKIY